MLNPFHYSPTALQHLLGLYMQQVESVFAVFIDVLQAVRGGKGA